MNDVTQQSKPTSPLLLIIFWLYVGIPLVIGIYQTLLKAAALFK
ncbi:oxalate:formate antiporter [Candidimonas humi]|uniref:Oxalate:formate antiporter n=1 Tax=Candidimonas humi TaxID=683355 RepID=A0ABV8P3V7_9BURK|nr:oxalate:formate antiporter [Candidimonas humi]MBV6306227.1 oxalate:formate antiporter [Candidimonas humi]